MNIFTRYSAYIKNNPEGYWFKRKGFGWGWTPATWQGWAITLAALLFIFSDAYNVVKTASPEELPIPFIVRTLVVIAVLTFICYKKGESPKWQWGLPDEEEKKGE